MTAKLDARQQANFRGYCLRETLCINEFWPNFLKIPWSIRLRNFACSIIPQTSANWPSCVDRALRSTHKCTIGNVCVQRLRRSGCEQILVTWSLRLCNLASCSDHQAPSSDHIESQHGHTTPAHCHIIPRRHDTIFSRGIISSMPGRQNVSNTRCVSNTSNTSL